MASEQLAFDEPNFENDSRQKMAHYFILAQQSLNILQSRLRLLNVKAFAHVIPNYNAAEQAWYADPDTNPTVFPPYPLTSQNLRDFYKKCDDVAKVDSTTSTTGLFHGVFAANNGAQFIHDFLNDHNPKLSTKITREGDIAQDALLMPAQKQAILAGAHSSVPAKRVNPCDTLRYMDFENPNIIHTVLIKDHGSSAMRGEYFIVTTILDDYDDDSADQEVPNDIMEEWVSRRVQ